MSKWFVTKLFWRLFWRVINILEIVFIRFGKSKFKVGDVIRSKHTYFDHEFGIVLNYIGPISGLYKIVFLDKIFGCSFTVHGRIGFIEGRDYVFVQHLTTEELLTHPEGLVRQLTAEGLCLNSET